MHLDGLILERGCLREVLNCEGGIVIRKTMEWEGSYSTWSIACKEVLIGTLR